MLVIDFIVSDAVLAVGKKERLERLYNELIKKDWFMTLLDLEDYIKVKEQMLADYEDRDALTFLKQDSSHLTVQSLSTTKISGT